VQSIGVQEFSFRITGVVGHLIIDIYKVQVVALLIYFIGDNSIGIPDTVDYIPSGDAWFDGNEGQGYVSKVLTGTADQLLEENEDFFGVAAVAQVVVSCVNDDGRRVEGCHQPIEEPVTGGEGRATETQVDGLPGCKIFMQALPESDGRTAVEKQFGLVGQ